MKLCIGFVLVGSVITALGYRFNHVKRSTFLTNEIPESTVVAKTSQTVSAITESYGLDASRSKFIAHAHRGGLLWFKGHDHLIGVPEFTGEARLDPNLLANCSLQITAKTASMAETSSDFTDAQKKIINKELHDIVFLPDQYPEIIFKSTSVSGKVDGNNQYDLKIEGNLTLNGVTRPIKIPTKVIVSGNDLRAQGEFGIDRSDFKVKATSAVHGLVRVRDHVDFTFDIVGRKQ
ncbi:MAG TPA: YceI family protein [Pyrinomonadaceae bacterium]|nr:YceI family protein [Pyrinomonadaceae bacterium]